MPLILAVEPDRRQASRIAAVLRTRPRTELVIAGSAESAIEMLTGRVPDVLLTSPLLSPQDEAVIAAWLRALGPAATNVQALTIPILSKAPASPAPRRGILSVLRRRATREPASDGCEPAMFADQVDLYADRASAERPPSPYGGFGAAGVEVDSEPGPLRGTRPTQAPVEAPAPTAAVLGDPPLAIADEQPPASAEEPVPTAENTALVLARRRVGAAERTRRVVVAFPSARTLPHVLAESRRRWIPGPRMLALPVPDSGESARMIVHQPAGLAARLAFMEQTTLPPYALRAPMLSTSWPVNQFQDVLAEWRRNWMAEPGVQVISEMVPVETADATAVEIDDPSPLFEQDVIAVADADVWVLMPAPNRETVFVEMAPASMSSMDSMGIVTDAMPMPPVLEDVMPARPAVDKPMRAIPPPVPTLGRKPRKRKVKPVQDEWGFFDPEQCGFATLLAKLDEITEQELPTADCRPPTGDIAAAERPSVGRRLGEARGATLLETAIVLPLLLLLTFSIVDFASIFYVYLALESGVSQATRYAITGNQMEDPDNPGEDLSREESIKVAMREATPTLTIEDEDFAFSHLPEGGDTWEAGAGEPDDIAKVTVTYRWTIFTPVIKPFFTDGQVNLTVESAMKNEGRFN